MSEEKKTFEGIELDADEEMNEETLKELSNNKGDE